MTGEEKKIVEKLLKSPPHSLFDLLQDKQSLAEVFRLCSRSKELGARINRIFNFAGRKIPPREKEKLNQLARRFLSRKPTTQTPV